MKAYHTLLLAYVAARHRIDYQLLAEEFHVTPRQIMGWLEELKDGGYIEAGNSGFYVTALGRACQSASWNSFVGSADQPGEGPFRWDALYIPENFDPEFPE
ncbi:MAG: hypothetical protein HFI42_15760 [Lachnospiraceae bacterium]|nr:hypothetical protein [Lachnospiraceae bacterium]MCI9151897.1 hypothetical protein [Lachnospiraceae bacterium]